MSGMPATRALTEMQSLLVDALVVGTEMSEAWKIAGYYDAATAYGALRSRSVQDALSDAREARIATVLSAKALKAVEALLDAGTPPATRFAAAKWVIERQDRDADASKDKPIHEMTTAELTRFMARAQATIDQGGDAPVIVVVPDDGAQPAIPHTPAPQKS